MDTAHCNTGHLQSLKMRLFLRRLLNAAPHGVNGRMFLEDLKPFLGLWKNIPESYFEIMQQDQAVLREEFSRRFGES
jgi:hypothetical protein